MNGECYNYTKKARNRSKLLSLVRSWLVVSFVEILKSAASHPFQMLGVRLSQCQMLFLRLSRDRFAFGLVRIHCCGGFSWGTEPGRGRAACTCSKFARRRSQRGSRERDVPLRRSCSTSGLGCSRLELLGGKIGGRVNTYETCVRSHHRSSRSVLHVLHRSHRHRLRIRPGYRILNRIHRPLGSYEQCVRSLSTADSTC